MERKNNSLSKTFLAVALAVVFSLLIISVISSISKTEEGEKSVYQKVAENAQKETRELEKASLQQETQQRINVLILGISGENYKSGELTDSIIFASIGEKDGDGLSFLISIPRDLWVKGREEEFTKINELYKLGGGSSKPEHEASWLIKEKVEKITGQKIQYTIVADLIAIERATEALGGININGKNYSPEEINEYIRDRSLPGGDFNRSERQQAVIAELLSEINESAAQDLDRLITIYAKIKDNVSVNIEEENYIELYSLVAKLNLREIQPLGALSPQTENLLLEEKRILNGYSVYALIPSAGEENYKEINEYINKLINQ